MGKSEELKTTTELVKRILEEEPGTRNSDDYLYYKVCQSINGAYLTLPFWKVIINRKEYGFPAFESVRRTRQKLQATYPELAADSKIEGHRMINEEIFQEYARSNM